MKTKDFILKRIEEYIEQEDSFRTKDWEDTYVTLMDYNNIPKTMHISSVDFYNMNNEELVRLFEFVILRTNAFSETRAIQFKSNSK